MAKSGTGAYRWVWGKTQDRSRHSRGQGGWNPLLAHLLDTGATARELWDRYLPDNVRAVLTEAFGGGDAATARAVVPFLAALHDLGKAAPAFLDQFDRMESRSHLRGARSAWEKDARSHGVPLPAVWEGLYWAHHQHITAATLPRLLGCDCSVANGQRCRAPEHKGLHAVAYALGGHHGHVPGAETVGTATIARGGVDWDDVRAELVEVTAAMMGVDLWRLAALVAPVRPAALIHLMGLVIMSDWIASNDDRYPYADLADSDEAWWQAAQDRAKAALTALCLDRWQPTEVTWQQLWPGTEPRPVQAAVMELMPGAGQTLVIVEAPPAAGKTRLALWCAHYLASRNGYQGLYVAVPMKADAGRIADEVKGFMRAAVANADATLAVVHADALEQQIVYDLIDADRPTWQENSPLDALASGGRHALESDEDERDPARNPAADEYHGRDRAVMDPWYLNRCVGLMAAFGVGTIDEVMLAAQPSKHWMLRLFALSCKTVVIDKAHAYELYQQDLLATTVQWLADMGASVIILSNALPAAVRTALTASWGAGLQVETTDAGDEGSVTVVDGVGNVRRGGPLSADTPQSVMTVRLRREEDPAGFAAALLDKARDGGCVGVVRNQVAKAVALYRAALAGARLHGWDESEILLLHEQFQTHQQRSIEDRVRTLLGKDAPSRPDRLLVITTQGAAQSVDFDYMVSDLAPVDLLVDRMDSLHRHAANMGHRRTWCTVPQLDVLFQADPEESDLPLVEPPRPRPGRRTGNPDGLTYAPYTLAATFRTLQTLCDQQGNISLCVPRDVAGLIASVYESRQTGKGAWGKLLERTWNAWQVELVRERLAADDNGVRPYTEGYPATVDWLVSGELNGTGERGGMEGLRALPRLSIPPVNAVCLYQHQHGAKKSLTYDAEGKLLAKFYSDSQLKKGVPPAVERQVKRKFLLHTVSMPGRWFEGDDRLPVPQAWPSLKFKPLDRSNVLLFDATGACVSGLAGQVHYDPRTGLRRL
ncbi:CRISPR-associated endonuclease Cas3'' [Streptomyces lavendulae]